MSQIDFNKKTNGGSSIDPEVISNSSSDSIETSVKADRESRLSAPEWKGCEKIAFRIAFIFFFLLTVPLDIDFYTGWFTTDWSNLHIRDLGKLSGSSFSPIKIRESNSGAGDIGSIA